MSNKKHNDPKALLGSKKLGFDHVPISGLIGIAKGMLPGVLKYGAKNWYDAEELKASVYLNGIMRHLLLRMAGEKYVRDADVLITHEEAIVSGASVLLDSKLLGNLLDDTVALPPDALNRLAKEICGEEYARLPIKEDK